MALCGDDSGKHARQVLGAPVQTSHGLPGTNNLEPELILAEAFAKRAAGYLDWDTYYDFNASEYAQTLKVGLEFELAHKEK